MAKRELQATDFERAVISFLYVLTLGDAHYSNLEIVRLMARYHLKNAATQDIGPAALLVIDRKEER